MREIIQIVYFLCIIVTVKNKVLNSYNSGICGEIQYSIDKR